MKNKIKKVRQSKGITQKELAEMLGIKPPTLSQIENGNNTKIETFEKVASALGCSIVELIDLDDFESAYTHERIAILDVAFDEAKEISERAHDIVSAAGYTWILPEKEDHLIHLVEKKTRIEYAVTDEAFTAAVDGSADYIKYNFEKLIKSAKIINNGK